MLSNLVPSTPIPLMITVYRKIFPAVRKELAVWKQRADEIPDEELRFQALASMSEKRFHCQGGAVYALLSGARWRECIRFIVAYQTISDYLDNLCDRSTTLDPSSFSLLHTSMIDAHCPRSEPKDYYAFFHHKQDNGYLQQLVQTCNDVVAKLDDIPTYQEQALQLTRLYSDLQVHKHVKQEERVPRLTNWSKEKNCHPLAWYEFSAATGSTLGIFCLMAYSLAGRLHRKLANEIVTAYFPYIQGLHILLDYYIDQQEDKEEDDLNFCSYYESQTVMHERFQYFCEQAKVYAGTIPNPSFHKMVVQGLVGLYLGDGKVNHIHDSTPFKQLLFQTAGKPAMFFYRNTRIYYFFKQFIH
ncbi:tetraprenyl-beta-curcumene synthase family protein [Virgibacillus pantothenticus]|uniref:tetraprenyl-beta-curcumene synthase family protein n=1 Tax=Virgibacillus pantothenticus TaxID=1473 RepID=UPI00098786F5|nr:tetraprenyl-beta-curcumene synthase family protein [Virgibacillus pantothenticus]